MTGEKTPTSKPSWVGLGTDIELLDGYILVVPCTRDTADTTNAPLDAYVSMMENSSSRRLTLDSVYLSIKGSWSSELHYLERGTHSDYLPPVRDLGHLICLTGSHLTPWQPQQ